MKGATARVIGGPVLVALTLLAVAASSAVADMPGKKSFDSNGVEIKYIVVGKGTPVLLIHGFAASALTNWAAIIPRLARNHQVLAIDNRGHGGSGRPVGEEYYGDEMINDSIRLLDHLGIEKAHVVGYSMGGYITAKMAAMYPGRMLSATIAGAGWAKEKSIRERTLDDLAQAIDRDRSVAPLLNKLSPNGEARPEIEIKILSFLIMFSNDPRVLASVARGMKHHTLTKEDILAIDVPTQLVVGSEDPIKRAADAWMTIRPDHRYVVIDGANHMTAITRHEFLDAIEEFITAVEKRR